MPGVKGFVTGRFFSNCRARIGQQILQAMAGENRLHYQKGAGQGKQ